MARFKKTQLITLFLISTLLFLTPLLSSSLRSTYLYLIINLLIISLGLEAGFLSPSPQDQSSPPQPSKHPEFHMIKTPSCHKIIITQNTHHASGANGDDHEVKKREKMVKKEDKMVKKCSSKPSIFFIESKVEDFEDIDDKRDEEKEEELFVKSEVFIGNFYKQLRMQREESWKRIHGFYQNGYN